MKKILLLLPLVVLLGATRADASAQSLRSADYPVIDQHVADTPKSATESVESLAAYLTASAKDDIEKVRAFYEWIILNIDYDTAALASGDYGDQSAAGTLKKRKAVCSGYSRLFQALARAAGIEAMEVTGFSRGLGYSVGQLETKPDHAWSVVKLDGIWRLVDCTWAAGYINSQNQFVRQPFDYYFLTSPDHFIYDHLPEDARWQIVEKPISKADFLRMVYLRPAFFTNDMKLVSHTQGVIKSDCCFTMSFGAPENVVLNARVMRGQEKDDSASTFIQRESGELKVATVFPKGGDYTLRLFAKRRDDPGSYDWAADYLVQVAQGTTAAEGFPQTYASFHDKNAVLIAPMKGKLKSGDTVTFKLNAPGAESVAVVVEGRWSKLEKNGDLFEGQAVVKGESVQIAAKYAGSNSFYVLLKYRGIVKDG